MAIQLPSYFLDEVRIDQEKMRWHEGPWWAPADGSIDFADVESVRIVKRLQAGIKKNRRSEEVWILQSSRGATNEVIVSRLWMEHYQDVKAHFEARGISFAQATQ